MGFSAPFIARPVATILLSIGLLLSGIVAYRFLPISALPERRHPHHRGDRRAPRRRSGDHGQLGRRAAGTPARRDLRRHRNHLHQLDRQHLGRRAVRHRPRHQRRRARRAGGDQRGDHRSAVRPSHAALLPQVQSGRCADHDAGAVVRHADHGADLRRRGHHPGATAVAGRRRLAGDGERRGEARGARAARSRPPRRGGPRRPGRAERDQGHQRAGADRRVPGARPRRDRSASTVRSRRRRTMRRWC